MLEGRKHARTPERFLVQILAVQDSRLAELAMVENVSSRGTRLATQRSWEPGSHVTLKCYATGIPWTRARVVYCQDKGSKEFGVGLNFLTQTIDWETPGIPSFVKLLRQN